MCCRTNLKDNVNVQLAVVLKTIEMQMCRVITEPTFTDKKMYRRTTLSSM